MKAIRTFLLALAALAAQAGLSTAQAAPLRFTFYDCGAYADCKTTPPTVLAQFVTPGTVMAPAVPPAGTRTPAEAVNVQQQLAGSWDDLGLITFNQNGFIGSQFLFENLQGASGQTYSPVMSIAPAFVQALELVWDLGTYTGLGVVNCYNVNCSITTTIRAYSMLVVDRWTPNTNTVPEPQGAALALAALALAAAATRRRGRAPQA